MPISKRNAFKQCKRNQPSSYTVKFVQWDRLPEGVRVLTYTTQPTGGFGTVGNKVAKQLRVAVFDPRGSWKFDVSVKTTYVREGAR